MKILKVNVKSSVRNERLSSPGGHFQCGWLRTLICIHFPYNLKVLEGKWTQINVWFSIGLQECYFLCMRVRSQPLLKVTPGARPPLILNTVQKVIHFLY